jgi:hypothetical protein
MSAGANRWVVFLWGAAPAGALLLFLLAYKAYGAGWFWTAVVFATAGAAAAVLRLIWRSGPL